MFFFLWVQLVATCEISVKFTECYEGTRAAVVSCDEDLNGVYSGLPCNFTCPPGQRLDIDTISKTLTCSVCPAGTYSIGGGDEFNTWNSFSEEFIAYCWVLGLHGWEVNTNCTPWHANSESLLVSGTGNNMQWYETDMVMYPSLVKDGSIEIYYRKETGKVNGYEVGDFYIFVDETLKFFDFTSENPDWQLANISLTKGTHKVQISFDKYISNKTCEVHIKSVQVRGSDYADLNCRDCENSHSKPGSDQCFYCEDGSFLDNSTGKCSECSPGTTSKPGSIGEESCFVPPLCTSDDWHYYYSDCEVGRQKKVFEWNLPLNCSPIGVSLPKSEDIECIPCGPGRVYKDNKCKFCPDGTFTLGASLDSSCLACAAGTHSVNLAEFSDWSKFPEEFTSSCITKNKQKCRYDWETRGTYLVTSPVYTVKSVISLQGTFEAKNHNATVAFSFVVKGPKTKFAFYINGQEILNFIGDTKNETKIFVERGTNTYKWICVHQEENGEKCEIHKITLEAHDVGGGNQCAQCSLGYFSVAGSPCSKCPAGQTSNSDRSKCEDCESGFVDSEGNCKKCEFGLIPTPDQKSCKLQNTTLALENSTFSLQNLVAASENMTFYCSQQRLEMFCYETFYGPVQSDSHYFYLSVLSPSRVEMPSYVQVFEGEAYAFAIINTKTLDVEQANMKKPQDCEVHSNQVVVNTGREVSSLQKWAEANKTGFNLKYTNGDLCKNKKRFSTNIQFVCDKDEKEGWPIFSRYENCEFYFVWPTVHGCQNCTDDMVVRHPGTCKHGKRVSYNYEGENCVFASWTQMMVKVEKCDGKVMRSWPFVLSVVLSFGVLIAVIVLVFLTCNKRRSIKRLVQYKVSKGEIEMSGK